MESLPGSEPRLEETRLAATLALVKDLPSVYYRRSGQWQLTLNSKLKDIAQDKPAVTVVDNGVLLIEVALVSPDIANNENVDYVL